MTARKESSPAFARIANRIRLEGAITVADYMAEVLISPKHGYYMAGEPFGTKGDFITAPEISQMFGELIGLWFADTWYNMGGPTTINLVELGPGRGTLMSDLLRTATMLPGVPGFVQSLQIHLVEISPTLRKKQKEALAGYPVTWHEDLSSLPEGPTFFLANEFFDALPIRQFERAPQGWCERLVTLSDTPTGAEETTGAESPAGDVSPSLQFTLSPPSKAIETLLPSCLREAAEGAIVERSPLASSYAHEIATHLDEQGGAALIIDYGWITPTARPSLQAVRAHKYHPVLEQPGAADLSALVDFPALIESAEKARCKSHGPITQGDFLRALGIEQRAEMLRRNGSDAQVLDITAAEHRLTALDQMGELFKVLALTSQGLPTPAAFPKASGHEHNKDTSC
ncbi:class I SAM-dependent methyltransferase [Kiloniella laminariae]|uniref:class I SAM-dependent methyltransferase n=1 Tax=Kiloniella laminariae TaxID=454162 RepID=UPI00036DB71D|nr:SAM-dependent methyltransferase [Kiloniella laminariae]